MSRLVSFGQVALAVASITSIGYAQCGGQGYYGGGYPQQRRYQSQPQSRFHASPGCCNGGGYSYGGGTTYAAPQGFGQTYQPQPYCPPQPRYSAPQGSGMRLFQGSDSR